MGRWNPIKGFSRTPGADRFALAQSFKPTTEQLDATLLRIHDYSGVHVSLLDASHVAALRALGLVEDSDCDTIVTTDAGGERGRDLDNDTTRAARDEVDDYHRAMARREHRGEEPGFVGYRGKRAAKGTP